MLTNVDTTFQTPQFPLLPDPIGPRHYANVDNRLEVSMRDTQYRVALAVPTGLFTLMKDVLGITPDNEVLLAIDQATVRPNEDDRFVFSVMCGDDLWDLWSYTAAGLPKWLKDPTYRLLEKPG